MKKTTLAATTLALTGALLADQNAAFAKGPKGIEGQQSQLILAKETQHTDLEFKDFPFGLEDGRTENPRITFTQDITLPEEEGSAAMEYVLTMPWLDVDKDGDEKVAITYPPEMKITINATSPEGDENITFDIDMISEDTVMEFVRDGDRMSYTGQAKAFSGTLNPPEEVKEEGEFSFTFAGKNMTMEGSGAAEQDYADLKSLDMAYDYTLESMTFDFIAKPEGDTPVVASGETGEYSFNGQIGDGVLKGGGVMRDLTVTVKEPMPLEVFMGAMATKMEMPTEPSPDPQDLHYMIEFEDIQLDDSIWAMADPGEAFPRELKKLTVDIGMKAMMFVSFLDPNAMAESAEKGMPPMMPTNVVINSIAFDGLGLQVNAEGEGALEGGTPQAAGVLSIKGLEDFVKSAQEIGAFGEQEGMMVQGMAQQFGKEGDDGALIFEVETKEGMVVVNGTPVAPLPQ